MQMVSVGVKSRFTLAQSRSVLGFGHSDAKAQWTGAFQFVQMADTQLGMMDSINKAQYVRQLSGVLDTISFGYKLGCKYVPNVPYVNEPLGAVRGRLIEAEKALARRAVTAINAMVPRPVFAVVCGDLVHSYPGVQGFTLEQHMSEVAQYKEILDAVHPDIALVCTCGNHDIGDRPTAATIDNWRANFGDDYFSFWVGGVKFVCLNTQLYKGVTEENADLAAAQDAWLDEELSAAEGENARRVVVFSHIPPFVDSPDEAEGYFPLAKEVRHRLLQKMLAHGVTHWFCGHYHRNAGGVYCQPCDESGGRQQAAATLEVVTTAAVGANIGTEPSGDPLGLSGMLDVSADANLSGLRVVTVGDSTLTHAFYTLKELESEGVE